MMVRRVRIHYHLTSRYERLRERGLLTQDEVAPALGVCTATVKHWRRAGLLKAHADNDKPEYLYEPPGPNAPVRHALKGLSRWHRERRSLAHRSHEVQCEA